MNRTLAVVIVVVGGLLWGWRHRVLYSAPPLHQSVNAPGAVPEPGAALEPGKVTVVHYYADWCPGCVKWRPTLNAVNARFDDVRVRFVNIDSFDSPVAQAHGIRFVPNFKVYDERGNLIAEDKAADRWLREEIARRVPSARAASE